MEESFREAQATIGHVLRTLDEGLEEPELVEGLVSTIQNGNLRELYLSSFDAAMAELKQAILEFSQLLKLAPSKELQARPEVRALQSQSQQPPPLEHVGNAFLERAIEFLGRDNVHGVEDVEAMLGQGFVDRSKVPLIPYTEADLAKSKKIKEKTGIQEMLVLFVTDKDGTPLTGERMNELIQAEYTKRNLGKFLIDTAWSENTYWYQYENFFQQLGFSYEWKLITKQCIPLSKSKCHSFTTGDDWTHKDTQEYAIETYARKIGVTRSQLHRPEPFQMLYATALHLVATEKLKGNGRGERLLQNEFHWSAITTSNRKFVCVGKADSLGAYVSMYFPGSSNISLGVCLSRDPSSLKSSDS